MNDFKKLKSNYWIIKKRTECALQVWDNSGGILPIGGKGSNRIKKNCFFSYTCEAMNNRSTTRNQTQQSKVSQTLTKNISFCLKPTCSVKHFFFFSSGFHETRNEFVNFKRIRQFQREIWNCNLKNSRRLWKLSE